MAAEVGTPGGPLILVAQPAASPAGDAGGAGDAFGSYSAVASTGQALLAADLAQRLVRHGARVVPLAHQAPPPGANFHWGSWFARGARAALEAAGDAAGHTPGAIGYAGGGALALAGDGLLAALVAADAAGAANGDGGLVTANNRFSADAFVVAGDVGRALDALAGCPTDNAAVRCLESAGFAVRDLSGEPWSRFDVDTPLDLALLRLATRLPQVRPLGTGLAAFLEMARLPGDRPLNVPHLARLGDLVRDREAELVIAGRIPSRTLAYLETEAACRVRAFVEERGMRAARDVRPRSLLADWGTRHGPSELIAELTSLGDGVILDSRVLMAAIGGSSDAGAWPPAEERYASDFGDATRIEDRWLQELTLAAASSAVPVLLGGHALVSDGLRLLVEAAWLGR